MTDTPQKPDTTLSDRVKTLESELESVRAALRNSANSQHLRELAGQVDAIGSRTPSPHPLGPIFLAESTATSGDQVAWKEKYVTDSGIVDFSGGRVVSDETSDTAAYIVPGSMGVVLSYAVPGGMRYAYFQGGNSISGLVTGNATGNGKYVGKSFAPNPSDVDPATNLAEADFGALADADDCLILNPVELGLSTSGHMVTETVNTTAFAIYFIGQLLHTNTDGTKVVAAMMFYAGC